MAGCALAAEFVRQFGFEGEVGPRPGRRASPGDAPGRADFGGAAHALDFVGILDEALAIEDMAQIVQQRRRLFSGACRAPGC